MSPITAGFVLLTLLVLLVTVARVAAEWFLFSKSRTEGLATELPALLREENAWVGRHALCASLAVVVVTILKIDLGPDGFDSLATAVAGYAVMSFLFAALESVFAHCIENAMKVSATAGKSVRIPRS